jgi:hypothetical protein
MNENFYVGYQKQMPAPIARFLVFRMVGLLLLVLALAVAFVLVQKPFPNSQFEFGVYRHFEGIVSMHPYPTLILCEPTASCSRYLLVRPGKHGAADLFADGQYVKLRGSLIQRDNRRMIEVDPESIRGTDATTAHATPEIIGRFTLRGEIVDSKCYLGVMKPGNLKPHKSCAIRCISGGCPPVLVVRDEEGTAAYFVLAASDGSALGEDVRDKIAEPLEITGEVERRDDLFVLKSDPVTYRRLE